MISERKAAARARGSGSKSPDKPTRSFYTKSTSTATSKLPQPGETAIYLGLDFASSVQPWRGQFRALGSHDQSLGLYRTSADAAKAVYASAARLGAGS